MKGGERERGMKGEGQWKGNNRELEEGRGRLLYGIPGSVCGWSIAASFHVCVMKCHYSP
jgi:hypothetical protein